MCDFLLMRFVFVVYYAVLEVGNCVFEVFSTAGNTNLGRNDLDKVSQMHIVTVKFLVITL